jgi:hypothetical protein
VTERFEPNFFDDDQREPWTKISFGNGAPVKAALTKIDGVSTKHTWKEQKSKETSGSVNTFSGTKYGHPKLTFTAVDEEDFDDLRALWNLMKPVPGQGTGAPAATPAPGQTFAIGSPAKGSSAGSSSSSSTTTETDTSSKKTDAKDNPGPRPPTIAVSYPLLLWHDITACALEEWEGPTPTDSNGMEVVITIIPDKPPVPAGVGAMAAPAPGSQFSASGGAGAGGTGGATGGSTGGGSGSITTNANAGAAGT